MHWRWVLLSLLPIFGTYYGRALRWAVFLRPLKPHPSITNLLSATVVGFTAITLFGRPGEFVRPYLIARKEQVAGHFPVRRLGAGTHLRSPHGPAGLRLRPDPRADLGPPRGPGTDLGPGRRRHGSSACSASSFYWCLLSLRHFAEPVRRRLLDALHHLPDSASPALEKLINAFFQGVESTRSDAALFLVFFYSVLEWVLICLCYWCLAAPFAGIVNLSLVDVLIFMGFVSFGSIVQIPGIGGGMQVVTSWC